MIMPKPSLHFASGGTLPIPINDLYCTGKGGGELA
jgi:hypothetical protein